MGDTNFQPREFPRSGSKAKAKERKRERRAKVGNNNGQLSIANATSGPIIISFNINRYEPQKIQLLTDIMLLGGLKYQ